MATSSARTIDTIERIDGFPCRVVICETADGAYHIELIHPVGMAAITLMSLAAFPTYAAALTEAREMAALEMDGAED